MAASGATSYDVYFGTDPSPPLVANTTSTSFRSPAPLAVATTYYWKVAARDPCGVGPPTVIFSFRTISCSSSPPAPSGLSPANNATGVSVRQSLSWSASSGASSYDVYFGTTPDPPFVANTAVPTYTPALTAETTYFWKVTAINSCGRAPSDISRFTTCAAPPPPGNLVPANGTMGILPSQRLSWSPSTGATSYSVYLGTTPSLRLVGNTSGTTYDPGSLGPGSTYFWQVVAHNACTSTPSSVAVFTTCSGPDAPTAFSPHDGQTHIELSPTLRWQAVSAATSYDIYFGSSEPPPLAASITANSFNPGVLQPGRRYHWRIVAKNECSPTSGPALTFTTASSAPPPAPVPVYPSNGTTEVPLQIMLQWLSPAEGASGSHEEDLGTAESYDVYFGKTNPPPPAAQGLQTTAWDTRRLDPDTNYYWYVLARNSAGATPSPVSRFATNKLPPAATLYYPRLVCTDGNPGSPEYTAIALLNMDQSPAYLTLTAFARNGEMIHGPDITNPVRLDLKAGHQTALLDLQVFGQGLPGAKPIGWFRVEGDVRKIVGFFLMLDSELTVLDGADAKAEAGTAMILPEVEDLGFTQIHASNAGYETAAISVELLKSDGTPRFPPAHRTVAGNGSMAELLSDLFPEPGASPSDYVRVTSTQPMILFEYLGRPGKYAKGLNGQPLSGHGATLYAPQYAVGGSWWSTLSVVNLEDKEATATFRLFGDNGIQMGATKQLTIPPHGKVYIAEQDFFLDSGSQLSQGYVQISSNGPKLTGSIVFGDPRRAQFSSALPLVSTFLNRFVFSQLASDETWYTGIAILNPDDSAATVTLDVLDENGTVIGSTVLSIPPGQRTSRLLTEYFPALAAQHRTKGYIRISSDKGLASFALFGTNSFSVLSAVPPQTWPD
jgi:hypothetical protein